MHIIVGRIKFRKDDMMFYIIEGDNVTEGEKGRFLVSSDDEFFLTSTIENATVFNRSKMEEWLKDYQHYGEITTLDGSLLITQIHEFGIAKKRNYKEFIEAENLLIDYEPGDLVRFGVKIYEVQGIEDRNVQLASYKGHIFSVSFEHVQLVEKAKDRYSLF